MTENTATFVATVDTRGSVNIPKSIQGLGFVSGVKVRVVLELVGDEQSVSPTATLERVRDLADELGEIQSAREKKEKNPDLEEATEAVSVSAGVSKQ